MSQYHIYQTPVETSYAFRSWEEAKSKFSMNDYQKIYSGELLDQVSVGERAEKCNTNDFQILEDLFTLFNLNHPSDYTGRSLSVSDVVEIVRKDGSRYYYCDCFGWKRI